MHSRQNSVITALVATALILLGAAGCGRSSLLGVDPGNGDGCFGPDCFGRGDAGVDLKGADLLEFEDLRGKRMSLSASKLSALHFRNGRVIYLSDLSPSEVEENPNYIRPADGKPLPSDLSYPWKADRSAAGSPIMIGGKEFRKGN